MKKKDYTVSIIVVVGLFFLTMMLIVATAPETPMQKPKITFTNKSLKTGPIPYAGRAHIEVIDQNVADKAVILSMALKGNGYVVIHKEDLDKHVGATRGGPGRIIGVSKMLNPGLYSNSAISLTEGVAPGEILYAMLHNDNGDGVFSADTDAPMKGDEMMMINGTGMMKFMAI